MTEEGKIRLLVTGGEGLLAQSMKMPGLHDFELQLCSRDEFDLLDHDGMARLLDGVKPSFVVNTAAYNLVDKCEVERDLSWSINAEGPKVLAGLCGARNIPLIHYGTDYVFDGAQQVPYTETDTPHPVNHYAAGKLAGEEAVLAASSKNLVLRTSWLFGINPVRPQRSFIHTILRQALDGKTLCATTDQLAAPTYVLDLAGWTLELVRQQASGLYHAVNDEGVSRYDWTKAILGAAVERGLLAEVPTVEPVTTAFFNSAIRRSTYSWLSNAKLTAELGHPLGTWRTGLKTMLRQTLWPEMAK